MLLVEFFELSEDSEIESGIIRYLTKQGYRKLGQGVDQAAFLEPSTKMVLKIFGTDQLTKSQKVQPSDSHKMFFTWARYCMANQNNPFLPKFSGYEAFIWEGRTYLQIRQERLREDDFISHDTSNLGYRVEEFLDEEMSQEQVLKKITSQYRDRYSELAHLDDRKFHLLTKTLIDLWMISKLKGWYWDLHSGNVMVRGRTPVIVDPWVTGASMFSS